MRLRAVVPVALSALLLASLAWAQFGRGGDFTIVNRLARPEDHDGKFHYCRAAYRLNPAGDGAGWLTTWAPGVGEKVTPAGTGTVVEPGTQIVMQIHYSLLASNGRAMTTDRSALKLRVGAPGLAVKPLELSLLPAPIELPCAAGETCTDGLCG